MRERVYERGRERVGVREREGRETGRGKWVEIDGGEREGARERESEREEREI
jgi:hypothetical protein